MDFRIWCKNLTYYFKQGDIMPNQSVFGIVGSRSKAETIIQKLIDGGVNPQDISFLTPQGEEFHDFIGNQKTKTVGRNWRTEERVTDYPAGTIPSNKSYEKNLRETLRNEIHTKAPEGTTTGVFTGGLIGGTLGLLAGIGALAIPGLGPFVAAGPLMATLAGIGSGGTLGGIIGALVGAGIPEYEAKRYENRLRQGGILLSIRANNDELAKRAKEILNKNGAEDVSLSADSTVGKNYRK